MGMFLAMSSVIGKTQNEVVNSLTKYAKSVGGGLEKENLSLDVENCCVIQEANNNTTVLYPHGYVEWDTSSYFISKDLQASVFSFHIHDGDLWMYLLFHNGENVDQFNPIPDNWGEVSDDEKNANKGNAEIVAKYVPGIKPEYIEKYLVTWTYEYLEFPDASYNREWVPDELQIRDFMERFKAHKAYDDDEFAFEDLQLLDFMKKLNLPYPIDKNRNPKGQTYKYWTNKLRLNKLFIGD
jgi:hypothetical protein